MIGDKFDRFARSGPRRPPTDRTDRGTIARGTGNAGACAPSSFGVGKRAQLVCIGCPMWMLFVRLLLYSLFSSNMARLLPPPRPHPRPRPTLADQKHPTVCTHTCSLRYQCLAASGAARRHCRGSWFPSLHAARWRGLASATPTTCSGGARATHGGRSRSGAGMRELEVTW